MPQFPPEKSNRGIAIKRGERGCGKEKGGGGHDGWWQQRGEKRSKATEIGGGGERRTPRSHVCLQFDRSSGAPTVNIRFAKISGFFAWLVIFCAKLGDAAGKKRTPITEERGKSQESYASYRMTHLRMALHRITRFRFRKLFGSDFDYERAFLQTWMYPRFLDTPLKPRFILTYHRRQFAVHSLPPSLLSWTYFTMLPSCVCTVYSRGNSNRLSPFFPLLPAEETQRAKFTHQNCAPQFFRHVFHLTFVQSRTLPLCPPKMVYVHTRPTFVRLYTRVCCKPRPTLMAACSSVACSSYIGSWIIDFIGKPWVGLGF